MKSYVLGPKYGSVKGLNFKKENEYEQSFEVWSLKFGASFIFAVFFCMLQKLLQVQSVLIENSSYRKEKVGFIFAIHIIFAMLQYILPKKHRSYHRVLSTGRKAYYFINPTMFLSRSYSHISPFRTK